MRVSRKRKKQLKKNILKFIDSSWKMKELIIHSYTTNPKIVSRNQGFKGVAINYYSLG